MTPYQENTLKNVIAIYCYGIPFQYGEYNLYESCDIEQRESINKIVKIMKAAEKVK